MSRMRKEWCSRYDMVSEDRIAVMVLLLSVMLIPLAVMLGWSIGGS